MVVKSVDGEDDGGGIPDGKEKEMQDAPVEEMAAGPAYLLHGTAGRENIGIHGSQYNGSGGILSSGLGCWMSKDPQ